MRVLFVTNMFPTAAEPWRGSFVRDHAESLLARGVDLTVFHFDGRHTRAEYIRAAARIRRLARDDFQLIHAHYGLTGAVAMAQRRLPVATTFYGSDTGYIPWQARISWIVARATTPIFVDPGAAERFGLPDAAVIPCGVDTELFVPIDRADARRLLGWAADRRYVLLPGARTNAVKGPELFAQVIEAVRERVEETCPVYLEGFSRREVALVMNAVDATLVTSRSEGSPASVKESLACTTPVVSVPVGDIAQVTRGLPGCAVRPRDPRELAGAVVEAFETERSHLLRERAQEYSRTRLAERLLEIYDGMLAGT